MSLLGEPDVFRFALESLHAGVYLVDLSRRIVCWNDGAERISGYLRHVVVGRICGDDMFLHCDAQGAELCGNCPLSQTMLDERSARYPFISVTKPVIWFPFTFGMRTAMSLVHRRASRSESQVPVLKSASRNWKRTAVWMP